MSCQAAWQNHKAGSPADREGQQQAVEREGKKLKSRNAMCPFSGDRRVLIVRTCVLIKHTRQSQKTSKQTKPKKAALNHVNPSALCGQNGSRLQASKMGGEGKPHRTSRSVTVTHKSCHTLMIKMQQRGEMKMKNKNRLRGLR